MLPTRRLLIAVLGVALVLGAFAVRDSFTSKLDRYRAAAILKREGGGTWKKVTCRPWNGPDRYWDYSCRVVSTKAKPFSFEIKVGSSGIADQSGP